jgi:hypothetical protein
MVEPVDIQTRAPVEICELTRSRKKMRVLLIFIAIFFSDFSLASDEKVVSGDGGLFLSEWLKNHKGYRLAELSDCNCLEAIKRSGIVIGKKYNPYSIDGNFDGDASNDFAYIVINEKKTDFLILVFSSRISHGRIPLVYGNIFGDTLAGLGLFKSKSINGKETLLFGAFGSESEPIHLPSSVPEK